MSTRLASLVMMLGLAAAVCHRPAYAAPGLPAGAEQNPPAAAGEINLKATSANVSEPGAPVRVQILRWSTDEERNPVVAALNPAPPPAAPARAAGPAAGAGPGAAGRGARGAAGRGGRGNASTPPDPIAALTAAIGKAPTLGYIWTNEVTGYSIKYAYHASLSDGGERIVLATDRRLGAHSPGWRPVASPTDYEFTLLEIHLNAKGLGEAKSSLTTKVIVDDNGPGAPGAPVAKTVALDNYASAPAIFQNVKR